MLAKSLSRWKQPLALIWIGRWDTATGSTAQTRPPSLWTSPPNRRGPGKQAIEFSSSSALVIGQIQKNQCLNVLARPKRFELLTPKFVVWCSIQLSYGRLKSVEKRRKRAPTKQRRALAAFARAGKSERRGASWLRRLQVPLPRHDERALALTDGGQ